MDIEAIKRSVAEEFGLDWPDEQKEHLVPEQLNVVGCAPVEVRLANIMDAPDFERIVPQPERDGVFAVIGYGPSVKAQLGRIIEDVKAGVTVCTTSGAHDFLLKRGIVPDYHADMDPRERKAAFVANPCPEITYLMASVCHPATWENLKGQTVKIWHLSDAREVEDFIAEREPGAFVHPSAQCIGLNAIILGHTLGFRRFHLYGLDCSYGEGESHAGWHNGSNFNERRVNVRCGDRRFETRIEWIQYARNFLSMTGRMPGCSFTLYGDGLLQHMCREALKEAEHGSAAA